LSDQIFSSCLLFATQPLFSIPIGLLLFVFPKLSTVSSVTISSYAIAIRYTINPISNIASSFPQIAQANVALAKIESLGLSLEAQVTEPDFPTGSDFSTNWISWKLAGFNHAYGRETDEHCFSLNHINLEFKPGKIVFIVG